MLVGMALNSVLASHVSTIDISSMINNPPSVGPGQVLHDLLGIDQIPKVELNQIYRQGDGSSIIPLAHEIKEGHLPSDFLQNQKDRSFFRSDAYSIEPLIAKIR